MSDEQTRDTGAAAGQGERPSVNLRLEGADLNYANVAVVTSTPEEVILNFGMNAVPPTPERQVVVQITDRIILSYPSAKRLAITLGNIIRRYEEARGVIRLPQPPQGQAADAQRPGGA